MGLALGASIHALSAQILTISQTHGCKDSITVKSGEDASGWVYYLANKAQ